MKKKKIDLRLSMRISLTLLMVVALGVIVVIAWLSADEPAPERHLLSRFRLPLGYHEAAPGAGDVRRKAAAWKKIPWRHMSGDSWRG